MSAKLTTEDFINRARATHGDRYDYSLVEYRGNMKNVKIICREHGVFEQMPANHMAGKGCKHCGRGETAKARKLSADEFKRRVDEIHNGAISVVGRYTKWEDRVECDCPTHGRFMALPAVLLRGGKGCMQCAIEVRGPDRLTKEEFIERAIEIHGDKYSYESVQYTTYLRDVEITCKEHGSFFQSPCNHIAGKGCPKCCGSQSKPEIEILDMIRACYGGEVEERNRKVIAPFELDILASQKALAIEFNGMYWHAASKDDDLRSRRKHVEKVDECEKAGLRLIQVREDKYAARPEVYRSIIANALNVETERVQARKCSVVELTAKEAYLFFDANHIDGSANCSVALGLEFEGEVVAAMSFGKPRYSSDHSWELIRFANKLNTRVVGGASKLFAALRARCAGSVVSYCNREHGTGSVYRALGMTLTSVSPPSYVWVKNGQKVFSRYQTQKHKLGELLKTFDPDKSEADNLFENGFRRYWDSGNLVFSIE